MIGTKCNSYKSALETLKKIREDGYDAIEINDFMIHRAGLTVKLMTKFGGMPIGNGVEGVVLETHKNWVNGDPLQSIQMSSKFMKEHFR